MAIAWTEKQSEIINSRDTTLLVSAAAGSGKTAVLVEHIISRICDEKNPIDADRFLLVTFTNAAAAQMRERINKAIDGRFETLEESGEFYKYLQRQQMLLGNAQISTIHQFCLSIIRNHFNSIELDPAFRLADEGELKLLKSDVVKELLETYYQEGNQAFFKLVESICVGKNDDGFEDLILKIFEASQSHPVPDEWLDFCAKNYNITSASEAEELVEFKKLLEQKTVMLESLLKVWHKGYMAVMAEGGPYVYKAAYDADREIIEKLIEAKSYSEVVAAWNSVKDSFVSFSRAKKDAFDETLVEEAK
ncbi:MAG: UvrD-helicase domain-containing protein, partial [Lachnospiraceae bacterium]|nr:UvrD-helicase domain-containing protein [Lachnospiraceae bacterium]